MEGQTEPVEKAATSATAPKKGSTKKQVINGIATVNVSYNNTLIAMADSLGCTRRGGGITIPGGRNHFHPEQPWDQEARNWLSACCRIYVRQASGLSWTGEDAGAT